MAHSHGKLARQAHTTSSHNKTIQLAAAAQQQQHTRGLSPSPTHRGPPALEQHPPLLLLPHVAPRGSQRRGLRGGAGRQRQHHGQRRQRSRWILVDRVAGLGAGRGWQGWQGWRPRVGPVVQQRRSSERRLPRWQPSCASAQARRGTCMHACAAPGRRRGGLPSTPQTSCAAPGAGTAAWHGCSGAAGQARLLAGGGGSQGAPARTHLHARCTRTTAPAVDCLHALAVVAQGRPWRYGATSTSDSDTSANSTARHSTPQRPLPGLPQVDREGDQQAVALKVGGAALEGGVAGLQLGPAGVGRDMRAPEV